MISLYVISNEQNKQNTNRPTDTENRLRGVRGEGFWGVGEKVKGLSRKKRRHRHECGDCREKAGRRGRKRQRGYMVVEGDFTFRVERTLPCTDGAA